MEHLKALRRIVRREIMNMMRWCLKGMNLKVSDIKINV
jgi:hypothetical protein